MKDYKQVWNNLSQSFDDASYYVCCVGAEDEIRRNGAITAEFLKQVLEIAPTDRVLEIGCGVARIGKELAQHCGEWHGTDISGSMIEYARERTHDIPNIVLYELPENNLSIFPDGYFDCVYSTIVFMHIDKLDMFTYIREAFRVLKPGGRAYFDTYNILAPEAWSEFVKLLDTYAPHMRPPFMSQFSTPQETNKFMEEAGFVSIRIDDANPQLVVAIGRKPEGQSIADEPGQDAESAGVAHAAPLVPDADDTLASIVASGRQLTHLNYDETAQAQIDSLRKAVLKLRADLDRTYKLLGKKDQEMKIHTETISAVQQDVDRLSAMIHRKDDYIARLEEVVSLKNSHIQHLDTLVTKQQTLLARLPVRIVLKGLKAVRIGRTRS